MTDKILPHSTEAEEAVIGTLISWPDSIDEVKAILTPRCFTTRPWAKCLKRAWTCREGLI